MDRNAFDTLTFPTFRGLTTVKYAASTEKVSTVHFQKRLHSEVSAQALNTSVQLV